MDPFSLTVGGASLIAVTAHAIHVTTRFVREVKHGTEAGAELLRELNVLHYNLTRLDDFLKTNEAVQPFDSSSVLVSTTTGCRHKMIILQQKLERASEHRLVDRLKWPFSAKEHQETIRDLRAFAQWIQFGLTIDGCALLSKTSAEVLEILKNQLETFDVAKSIDDRTRSIERTLEEQIKLTRDEYANTERQRVLDWISSIDHEQKHQDIRSPRLDGTGEWFLQAEEFQRWHENRETCENILWCQGIQGSGKSIIASLVIDNLRKYYQEEQMGIAYFYFEYRDQENQPVEKVISSLLKQLVMAKTEIPKAMSELYHRLNGQRRPQYQDLEDTTSAVCKNFDRLFVVIDALDESNASHRGFFFRFLERIGHDPAVSILLTSRPHLEDTSKIRLGYTFLQIEADESDLRRYVAANFERSDFLQDAGDGLKREIITKIVKASRKMFLLAVLQVQSILDETCVGDIEEALEQMPCGIAEAVEETLQRIRNQPGKRSILGMTALMWISHAKRSLQATQLSEALAIKLGRTSLERKYWKSPDMIISCCLGLVNVDKQRSAIRLVHYAVQEYFREHDGRLFPLAEQLIAEHSLNYLLSDDFASGSLQAEKDIQTRLKNHPFSRYAARNWGYHVANASTQQTDALALKFLHSKFHRASAVQISKYVQGYNWDAEEAASRNGLLEASRFGLVQIVEHLLDSGECDVNYSSKMGTTALIQATARGDSYLMEILLKWNADPTLRNWNGTALHQAARLGKLAGISVLLDTGMDVDIKDDQGRTPLHCAVITGHVRAIQLLLQRGAQVDATDGSQHTPLRYALVRGRRLEVIHVLLESKARTEARSDDGASILHHAVYLKLEDVVTILLDSGADVNAKDHSGNCPLHVAAKQDKEDIIQTLLERKADLNAQTRKGATALFNAAEYGVNSAIRTLLEYGPALELPNEDGLTALHVAFNYKHRKAVELLLQAGAEVDAQTEYGRSLLTWGSHQPNR